MSSTDARGQGPSQRQLRVAEQIRHTLAELMREGHFRDPDLQRVPITVSEVEISPDLKNATAFIMTLGGEALEPVTAALNRASSYLRTEVARKVRLRHAPRLRFAPDTRFEAAAALERALNSPKVRRDLEASADEEDID